jgi:polyisoprenoid-binding protein YceI
MDDDTSLPNDDTSTPNRTRTWIIRIAIGAVALIALVYGAIFFYVNVINDSPDALDEGDLSAAVADTPPSTSPDSTSTDSTPTDSTVPDTSADTSPPDTEPAAAEPDSTGFDGTWTPTDASEFGYRVEEVIAGVNTTAVGRSNEIEGALLIDGTNADVEITVQIENITSDDSRRDGQFRGRIMEADQFSEATFASTEPVEFGTLPVGDEQVTATVTGDLTLKDVTRSVTFEITAESNGERIGVLGNIPVLFADYGIDNPSFGAVTTEDDGLLEFVLVFEPA